MDKFHALAEPTRRQIVEMLAREGALTAGDIQARFSVSAPAISQHLKVLREADLVRIYRVNPEAMLEMEEWARRVRQLWTGRFDALEALLRAEQSKTTKE